MAGRRNKTYPAAEDAATKAEIDGIKRILGMIKSVNTKRLEKIMDKHETVDIKDLESLGGEFAVFFCSHIVRTAYTLQIQKIENCTCRLCVDSVIKDPRMDNFFQTAKCLLAPVTLEPGLHGHERTKAMSGLPS